ncbi:MAG TPA: hypothetical protein VN597_17795, partial [Streptosporangiaceae bacterium]|nr:hypothetical protein [Streptosporangiaceae bacterium]
MFKTHGGWWVTRRIADWRLTIGRGQRITAATEPVFRSNTQRVLDILPFVILAAVSLAADLIGPGGGLLSLLSLGPAFAAV